MVMSCVRRYFKYFFSNVYIYALISTITSAWCSLLEYLAASVVLRQTSESQSLVQFCDLSLYTSLVLGFNMELREELREESVLTFLKGHIPLILIVIMVELQSIFASNMFENNCVAGFQLHLVILK